MKHDEKNRQDPGNFETADKKPPHERKQDGAFGKTEPVGMPRTAAQDGGGDANVIGSPDLFLTDRHRELRNTGVKIRQVWADGADRGYVIVNGSQFGYFELSEGMARPEAEAALDQAYDGSAVVL